MSGNDDKKEQAKALYLQGVAIAEIARRLEMSRKQVQRWKTAHDWDALKLPQPERPKIVNFERPRTEPSPSPRAIIEGDYGTLDGLLAAIDEAITMARAEIAAPTVPQNFGAGVNGLCKLIEQRQKLVPLADRELIKALLERGTTPRELLDQLREAGWLERA